MKKGILLIILVLSISLFSQSKNSLNTTYNLFKSFNLNLKAKTHPLNFDKVGFSKKKIQFSSYNKATKLNDHFLIVNNKYQYNTSTFLSDNSFRTQKIDSFNPYGVSDTNSALIFGILGEFLNELQK